MSIVYDFYPAVLYALNLHAQGHTVTEACAASNISVKTFLDYVNRDAQLKGLYDEAAQMHDDALMDALVNIDNHKIHGQSDARMAGVVSKNIQWVLSKRNPGRFGDRLEVKHEITADKAIVAALNAAKHRVAAALPPPSIEDAQIVADFPPIRR